MRGEAVDDGAHRMFTHAEVQVASGMAPDSAVGAVCVGVFQQWRIEVAHALQGRFRRRIEIGRSASQRKQFGRNGVHHLAGCFARGEALGISVKYRDVRVPARRLFVAQTIPKFFCHIRERLGVGAHALVPQPDRGDHGIC